MKEKGHIGFSKDYWDENYSEPKEMDGIANAKEHAQYIKSFFDIECVQLKSVIDFGFGTGDLFNAVLKKVKPKRALGIEPSAYAFEKASRKYLIRRDEVKLSLKQKDLLTWCQEVGDKVRPFDLGICTSVFQYLSDEEIKQVLPVMAQKVKYLYFSVPTDLEFDRQVKDLDFKDQYAVHRSQKKYLRFLSSHFTFISSRLLESKVYFDEKNTPFTDLLFRF
jgi:hypothetical protein